MINALILICFFILSILIFVVNNYLILSMFLLFNLLILLILKVKISKYLKFLNKNLLFILFIFICNILFVDINMAILTSFKLFLAINFTYTISQLLPISKISEGFYYIFYPLKIFKVNIKDLSLIISIALTFIPILINEATTIKYSLISKGFDFNLKNALTKPHIFLITYLNNLFDRVDALEKTLLMKAYE